MFMILQILNGQAPGAGPNKDGAVVDKFMKYAKTGESVKSS